MRCNKYPEQIEKQTKRSSKKFQNNENLFKKIEQKQSNFPGHVMRRRKLE